MSKGNIDRTGSAISKAEKGTTKPPSIRAKESYTDIAKKLEGFNEVNL